MKRFVIQNFLKCLAVNQPAHLLLIHLRSKRPRQQQVSYPQRMVLVSLLGLSLIVGSSVLYAQQVTLNFKKMDINLLIDTVAEVTGRTFVVDPRVKAEITVVSSTPMSSDEVYEVFLSILSVHGFAAVPSGSIVKIIPENLAKSESSVVLNNAEAQFTESDALVTQVLPVKHVSAAQLVPLLRPLVPQQGHLVAYPSNNTLIVSDRADNVVRLRKIISRIDKPDSQAVEVIVLEHASAVEVTRILSSLEQKRASGAATNGKSHSASILADERTNSVLIGGNQETRLRLRALISHLDTPLKSQGNTQVIYLRYAQAEDLVNVLQGISDTIIEQKQAEGQATPPEFSKTNIQADESTNSLVITAPPDVSQNLQNVIQQLDVRRAQVLVEAIIAEVELNTARELGVQWFFDGTPNSVAPVGGTNFTNAGPSALDLTNAALQLDNASNLINLNNLPNIGAGAFLGVGRFGSSTFNFAAVLRALTADTNTNVVSTPSLMTLDNEEAEITVGQNVPFITGQFTSTGANTGATNPFQTIQRQDIGLKLKIRPQINEGNAVQMEIEQELSSISPSTIASDIITNVRSIKTSVIVDDDSLLVLGGLITDDLQQTEQKVPGLGDLPLVGGLFRSQSTTKVKRNLMVFLHPRILREDTLAKQVSQRKYSYLRARQLEQQMAGAALLPNSEIPVLPELGEFLVVLPGE